MDATALAEQFELHRGHLRRIAHQMLGSATEAEDAVQEAWLRVQGADPDEIRSMRAWLGTVVGRVCLNKLRSRRARPELLTDFHVPDPVVTVAADGGPEPDALLAESIGLALLVVLDRLSPAERVAFVLHDVFGLPFTDVAAILERSEPAAQQLASRARRRLSHSPEPDRDLARQRQVVDAFFSVSRDGDFAALVAVLAPDVELRIDAGDRPGVSLLLRGADAVAGHTSTYAALHGYVRPAIVNGAAGAVVVTPGGRPFSVMSFTVVDGRITRIDALADPGRVAALGLDVPPEERMR